MTWQAWTEWTPWGEVESRLEGPSAGDRSASRVGRPGAGVGLTHPDVESRPPPVADPGPATIAGVDYLVEVEDGAIRFEGTIAVQPHSARLTRELDRAGGPGVESPAGLDRPQPWRSPRGANCRESLARLKAHVEGRTPVRVP